jgi:AraC-like DNA-binding protein
MILDNITPNESLKEFVRIYRIIEFTFSDDAIIPPKAYTPRPEHCLQFYPKDTETVDYPHSNLVVTDKKVIISGQPTLIHHRLVKKEFLTFQIVFQPGALYRLTGIPSSEITNCYLDAGDILGNTTSLVNEQLYHANNYNKMILIIEEYLQVLIKKTKLKIEHSIDIIGQLMLQPARQTSLDWYAKEACICYRQFDRKFKERLGINPKEYERIIRFDKVFRMKNRFPNKDWLSIALHCGYYDYQHLTKEFKEFTDKTPTDFFEIKGPEYMFGEREI